MKIFISHSFEDKDRFDDLSLAFDQSEIEYFNPKNLVAGSSLQDQLRQAILECTACVFIATKESITSPWCQAEIGAFWGTGKRVIIFIAEKHLSHDTLPPQFKGDIWHSTIRDVVRDVIEAMKNNQSQNDFPVELFPGSIAPIIDKYQPDKFRDLFICGVTLMHVTYRRPILQEIVENSGRLRLLIPNPIRSSAAIKGLRYHWHHGPENFDDFLEEVKKGLESMKILSSSISKEAKGCIEVRYLESSPTLSMEMAEFHDGKEEIEVELLPFRTDKTRRPHFVLTPHMNPFWHNYFKNISNDMWNKGKPLNFREINIKQLRKK